MMVIVFTQQCYKYSGHNSYYKIVVSLPIVTCMLSVFVCSSSHEAVASMLEESSQEESIP